MEVKNKDLEYYRKNAEEDYMTTPISVLRYIGEMEKTLHKTALVTPDNYFGIEEWYIPVIECPKCKHKAPARNSNYCNGCGVKLKLSTTVQTYI